MSLASSSSPSTTSTTTASVYPSNEEEILSWSHLISLLQFTPYSDEALPLAVCGPWRLYGDTKALALYYSNSVTQESVWDTPSDWDDSLAVIPPLAIVKDWYIYRDLTYGLQYFVSASTGVAVWTPPPEITHLVIEGEGCLIEWEEMKEKEEKDNDKQDNESKLNDTSLIPRSNRRSSIGEPSMVMIKTKLSKLPLKSLSERENPIDGTGDALVRVNDWLICQSSAEQSYGCIYFYHRLKGTSQWEPSYEILEAPDSVWRVATLADVGDLFLQTLNISSSNISSPSKALVDGTTSIVPVSSSTVTKGNPSLSSTVVSSSIATTVNPSSTPTPTLATPRSSSSTGVLSSASAATVHASMNDPSKLSSSTLPSSSSLSSSSSSSSSSSNGSVPIVIDTPAPRSVFLPHDDEERKDDTRYPPTGTIDERPTTASSSQREFAAMTKRLGHAPPAPLERPKSYANLPVFNFQSGLGLGLGRPGASIVRTRRYSIVTEESPTGGPSLSVPPTDSTVVSSTVTSTLNPEEQTKEENLHTWLASTIAATVDNETGEKLLAPESRVDEMNHHLTELEQKITALEKQKDELQNLRTPAAEKRRYEINQQLIRHRQAIAKMSEWLANQKALAAAETRHLLEQNETVLSAERTAELERRKNETAFLRGKLKADRDRAVGNLSEQRKADAEKAKQAMVASLLAARQEEEARTKMIRERAEAERKRRSSVTVTKGGGGKYTPGNHNALPQPKQTPPPPTSSNSSTSSSSSGTNGGGIHSTSTTGRRNSLTNAGRSIVKG